MWTIINSLCWSASSSTQSSFRLLPCSSRVICLKVCPNLKSWLMNEWLAVLWGQTDIDLWPNHSSHEDLCQIWRGWVVVRCIHNIIQDQGAISKNDHLDLYELLPRSVYVTPFMPLGYEKVQNKRWFTNTVLTHCCSCLPEYICVDPGFTWLCSSSNNHHLVLWAEKP